MRGTISIGSVDTIVYAWLPQLIERMKQEWCRGPSPITTKLLALEGAMNVAITVGGQVVHPGDAVLSDESGVVVLAPERARAVAERAIAMQQAELVLLQRLRNGERLADITVSAVVTERGRIACTAVVLPGGAWSRLFCGNLGIDLPQLKMLGSVLRTHPLEGPAHCAVGAGNFAFRKRLDGGYTVARRNNFQHDIGPDSFRLLGAFLPTLKTSWREVSLKVGRGFLLQWQVPRRWALEAASPFEAVRELDPEPSAPLLAEGMRNLARAFPAFAGAREAARWGCMVDATPDAVPVI